MKKSAIVFSALLTATACAGCGNENKVPKDWYNDSIAYFQTAVKSGWDKADPEKYNVMEPMKYSSKSNSFEIVGSGGIITAGKYELIPFQ